MKKQQLAQAQVSIGPEHWPAKVDPAWQDEMIPVTWPEFGKLHPFAPVEQAKGYARLFADLERWLSEITGFAQVGPCLNSLVDQNVARWKVAMLNPNYAAALADTTKLSGKCINAIAKNSTKYLSMIQKEQSKAVNSADKIGGDSNYVNLGDPSGKIAAAAVKVADGITKACGTMTADQWGIVRTCDDDLAGVIDCVQKKTQAVGRLRRPRPPRRPSGRGLYRARLQRELGRAARRRDHPGERAGDRAPAGHRADHLSMETRRRGGAGRRWTGGRGAFARGLVAGPRGGACRAVLPRAQGRGRAPQAAVHPWRGRRGVSHARPRGAVIPGGGAFLGHPPRRRDRGRDAGPFRRGRVGAPENPRDPARQRPALRRDARRIPGRDGDADPVHSNFGRSHSRGAPPAGIAYCYQGKCTVGELVRVLLLIHDRVAAEDITGALEYL